MPDLLEQYFFTPNIDPPVDASISPIFITWAGHRYCDASHNIGPRVLDTFKVVFVISGKGYLVQDDHEAVTINAGDMFILFPLHRHHYWADPEDPWEITWVAFNGSDCITFLNALHLSLTSYVLYDVFNDSIKRTMACLVQALNDQSDCYRLNAVAYLFRIIEKVSNSLEKRTDYSEEQENSLIAKVAAFIEQNYYMDIGMDMLCQQFSYSRSYLSRVFKAEMNITIQEFLINTRIHKAKYLLQETSLPVKEIAFSVGINDSLYFSKLFKKETGFTPTEFRTKSQHKTKKNECQKVNLLFRMNAT